jgi:hypothetical protein
MPNRLAGETSPYLLQHANNPVDWFPWGPDALARAKLLDRPIFLSIGYAACHWCHVMERESFEHEPTARYLNDRFVAIKVDREERPDLDQVYMSAVQAMTGGGGWPMSGLPDARGPAVLRRHLLPRRAAPRDAVVPPGPRGRRPCVARSSAPSRGRPAAGSSRVSSARPASKPGGTTRPGAPCCRFRCHRGLLRFDNGGWVAPPSSPSDDHRVLLRLTSRRRSQRCSLRGARSRGWPTAACVTAGWWLPSLLDNAHWLGPALRADALRQTPQPSRGSYCPPGS